jgi:hypothetical protein
MEKQQLNQPESLSNFKDKISTAASFDALTTLPQVLYLLRERQEMARYFWSESNRLSPESRESLSNTLNVYNEKIAKLLGL